MFKPELKHRRIGAIGILCFCLLLPFPQEAKAATEQYIGSFGGIWGIPNTLAGDGSFYLDGTIVPENGYILPGSDAKYYTESDIKKLTHKGIRYAINEIYAENGYIFTQKKELKEYFEKQAWYDGDTTDQSVVRARMNKYELENIDLLLALENKLWGGEYELK